MEALERDFRTDVSLEFIDKVHAAVEDRDTWLFKDHATSQIDDLRTCTGSSMEGAVLDNLRFISVTDKDSIDILLQATAAALEDHAARCIRQVEEHYLRVSNAPRSAEVRARMEDTVAATDLAATASRLLRIDSLGSLVVSKQTGIDDGVELP